jgi:hypothetical protein
MFPIRDTLAAYALPIAESEWWKDRATAQKDSYANAPSNLLIIIQAARVLPFAQPAAPLSKCLGRADTKSL